MVSEGIAFVSGEDSFRKRRDRNGKLKDSFRKRQG